MSSFRITFIPFHIHSRRVSSGVCRLMQALTRFSPFPSPRAWGGYALRCDAIRWSHKPSVGPAEARCIRHGWSGALTRVVPAAVACGTASNALFQSAFPTTATTAFQRLLPQPQPRTAMQSSGFRASLGQLPGQDGLPIAPIYISLMSRCRHGPMMFRFRTRNIAFIAHCSVFL